MGKSGEERALDSELRVLGLVPNRGPETLEHVFAHPASGQSPSVVCERDGNDPP